MSKVSRVIIINFSHPLTDEQIRKIEEILGSEIGEIRNVKVQFNNDVPFDQQVAKIIDNVGLSPEEWQTLPILIIPPSLNYIAVILQATLHGLMGYFAPIIRIKPVKNSIPLRFEVAEIINLQSLRERFRKVRQ